MQVTHYYTCLYAEKKILFNVNEDLCIYLFIYGKDLHLYVYNLHLH